MLWKHDSRDHPLRELITNGERDEMMRDFGRALDLFERTVNGESYSRAGAAHGITQSRVEQLTRWTTSLLLNPNRLQGDVPPDHDYYSVVERRQHADFWRKQVEKARAGLGKGDGQ